MSGQAPCIHLTSRCKSINVLSPSSSTAADVTLMPVEPRAAESHWRSPFLRGRAFACKVVSGKTPVRLSRNDIACCLSPVFAIVRCVGYSQFSCRTAKLMTRLHAVLVTRARMLSASRQRQVFVCGQHISINQCRRLPSECHAHSSPAGTDDGSVAGDGTSFVVDRSWCSRFGPEIEQRHGGEPLDGFPQQNAEIRALANMHMTHSECPTPELKNWASPGQGRRKCLVQLL